MVNVTGTLTAVGSTFSAGTITQISRANPGNDFQVAGMPGGAATGELLFDQTANSYAAIVSVSTGTATCTSPQAAAGLTTPTNTVLTTTFVADGASWTVGDTLQIYAPPTIYADEFAPVTGTMSATPGTSGMSWIQGLHFGDPVTGTANSRITVHPVGQFTLTLCTANSAIEVTSDSPPVSLVAGPQGSDNMASCAFLGGGHLNGAINSWGNLFSSPLITWVFENRNIFSHDSIVDHSPVFIGPLSAYSFHLSGSNPVIEGGNFFLRTDGTNGSIWGAAVLFVYPTSHIVNRTGGTWANVFLVTSKVTTAGLTTASAYNSGTGVWTGGISITSANIDSNGGLVDPVSGAGYSL